MQKWRGLALTFLFAALVPSVAPAQDDLVHRYDHLTCYADPQFDIGGAVKVDYGSPLGFHHNPVTISQFAICAAEQWRKMGSAEARKVFLDQIHWLKTHATSDDQNGAYYAYHFPWAGYGLAADWRSGLAQGQAISALIRYYRYIGDLDVLSLTDILRIPARVSVIFRLVEARTQQNAVAPTRWQPNRRVAQLAALEFATFPCSRRSPPVISVRSIRAGSCWRRWCSQPRDELQNILEHLPRHCDLGHLKCDVTAMAHDLGADLDQLLAQAGQRPRLCRLGHRQRPHEIAEVVREGMELETNRVGGKGSA